MSDLTDRLCELADGYEHGMPWPHDELLEAADEIERLTKENAALQSSADDVYARLMPEVQRLRDAVNYAHSEGFEYPADPLATAIYVGPKPTSVCATQKGTSDE